MEKSDLPERPDHCSIILVHGTWGRGIFPHTPRSGERWFDANSSFCAGLKRSLDLRGLAYDIESFEWSGANSFIERYRAASALAERLQNKHAPPFDSRIVCIAHSHGGNVVMKAVEILGKDCPPTEIITLAIPFFRVESLYNKPISIGFEFNGGGFRC